MMEDIRIKNHKLRLIVIEFFIKIILQWTFKYSNTIVLNKFMVQITDQYFYH
jgi:hypothetical protein